jgi:hypothetical protein
MKTFALAILLALIPMTAADAVPVYWSDNGHYYELILPEDPYNTNDWFSAKADAEASVHAGLPGHLVTITSQEENDFIYANFDTGSDEFLGAWIGGNADTWTWLSGPESGEQFIFTYWGGAEPNNRGYIYMGIAGGLTDGGRWADDSREQGYPSEPDPVIGYIIEYEVPEPATLTLIGGGCMGIVFLRRPARPARRG